MKEPEMIQDCVEVFEVDKNGSPTVKLLGYAPIDPTNARDCASAHAANWLLRNNRPKARVLLTTYSTVSSLHAPFAETMVIEFDTEAEAQRAINKITKDSLGTTFNQRAVML